TQELTMAASATTYPVVIGYDGSAPSEAALQWAARAAEHRELGLVVMHAAEQITYTQDAGSGLRKAEDIVAEAAEVAAHGRDTVLETFPDLEVETVGSLFSAKVALGEMSTRASMVVVGSHGRGRVGTFFLGSTAYAIAAYSRCPVIIVHSGSSDLPGPERPVVVGVNGTGGADRAVDRAVQVAREWHAPLVLATTWAPAPPDPWDKGPVGYHSAAEASADYKATAERVNAEALERIGAANEDLRVAGTVIEDRAVEGLVQAGDEGGLLVLGTRGHGSQAGALLGSVSLGILHRATSPIMIVN
ncbi:MAG: universal stress protein, partial [Ornithinimicrobium sp.]